MPRFFSLWASALLLMSAGAKEMVDRIDAPAADAVVAHSRHLTVHPGPTLGTSYEIKISGCVVAGADHSVVRASAMPVTFTIPGETRCMVDARRLDGDLWTPWTVAQNVQGESVVLDLPIERTAGLGLTFKRVQAGALIHEVHAGLPGNAMGLEEGDVLTTVNNRVLADLNDKQMVALLTGPEHSLIELGIIDVRTGRLIRRSARRAYVDVSNPARRLIPIIRR